jgi:hypothetical protein
VDELRAAIMCIVKENFTYDDGMVDRIMALLKDRGIYG